ncbi:Acetyltransferase (GNAT) family protein [Vibrio crassostreae]|nr:acetyltransferase (GNAT) family protein [Vibrio crassostreae]CAK1917384.1 Acetyltransferase (GNAT) family protein [Vibrio crassostreae]CAK1921352.1 Acetyltransferase (GNAT) family protein [Vibrio crassostreae]CAK2025614.1 Acetyltransferase (GNAT) family protein [Vibrio crassostreae]CAK2683364.1 Acetyltransferase (GNAT) family protein [Vibrio crassostreae]
MEVKLVKGSDPKFAESITKTNMASYYQARGIAWGHSQFLRSWDELDNYEIYVGGNRIGVIRFSYTSDTTFLRDFQILAEHQGRGFGAKCLDLVIEHANSQASTQLVLRVFSENPAIKLYQSKGFTQLSEVKGLVEMELILGRTMDTIIKQAIELRKEAKYQESRELLAILLDDEKYAAKAHLHIAWSYDNQGKEQQAIEHYVLSLSGVLSSVERFDALFGLASTYRSLGLYAEALSYFEQTMAEYPDSLEVQPFYAMCLYNLGRHKEATSLLLELLVSTTNSEAIKEYQRAISLYAQDLDKTW